ncbi:MAG: transposase family protein [Armatimonadota bacterium]|nr:transposase family protein [Armatimonadota bacterium]
MSPQSIREYAARLRPPYALAARGEKSRILNEFCRVTGYHRKSAIRLLQPPLQPGGPRQRRRGRPVQYGPPVAQALQRLWETSDYLGSKRLAPFLPELLRVLERQGELRLPPRLGEALRTISPATIDRLLRPSRRRRPHSPSGRPPSVLFFRRPIPVRTFGEWRDVRPGALQADLVLHCGETLTGFSLASLLMIDVATGWTACRAVWGAGQERVGGAIHHIAAGLPFPLQALHTDNGREFINRGLLPWCRRHGISFTRGRPGRKNDQAYAEQRIWTVIRRFVGYDRYRTRPAYDQLNRLYELLGLYLNFFQPLSKVVSKLRHGARVTKRYDRAQTPYQRLLAAGSLSAEQREALEATYLGLNPVRLRKAIQETQARLWKLAEPSPR